MGQHEGYRYHRRLRNEKEGEDSIAQDIFEAWSPALSKHLLKYRDKPSCDYRTKFGTTIFEHIESYRIVLVCRIKEDDIIGP